jgi:hypothetical protein
LNQILFRSEEIFARLNTRLMSICWEEAQKVHPNVVSTYPGVVMVEPLFTIHSLEQVVVQMSEPTIDLQEILYSIPPLATG